MESIKMKKVILFLFLFVFSANAKAEWLVNVSWVASPGPNLETEEVWIDMDKKCVVKSGDPTNCDFVLEELNNQRVIIRSINNQGAFEDFDGGKIFEKPTSASGLSIIIKWQP
jgi:hypothetical protein